jgi:hypothetical protein
MNVTLLAKTPGGSDPAPSPNMADQTDQEQDEEDKEQNFRNAGRGKSDGSETQKPGNYRDDEENQRVIQHVPSKFQATNPDARPCKFPLQVDQG